MKKRAVIADYLPWLLIAVAVIVIVMITVFFLRERGISIIDQIKDLFKGN